MNAPSDLSDVTHSISALDLNADLKPQMGAHWMPFTYNRQYKQAPRLLVAAEGVHYTSHDGRKILDGAAGLWCVNAGHCRKPIVDAISKSAATLDFAPPFQMGHPAIFEAANRIIDIAPKNMGQVFFTCSGSEAVDTAMKIALAYHRARGEGQRRMFIGRERGYHGVGFGGISVGGMVANRKVFGSMLPAVDHMPHTHDLAKNAYSRGEPEHGAELADELEKRIIALHDASNIAAVIVEPVAGSTGVLIPPKGYLKRLRAICDKYNLLLIFDEVITGFGRVGAPFASQRFDVVPDMICFAKGVTSGAVPMGGVICRKGIYETFEQAPWGVELFHGYTYSGHPLAAAAANATIQLYHDEGLLTRAQAMENYFADAVHSLKGKRHVIDTRNIGFIGAVELAPKMMKENGVGVAKPGMRGFDAMLAAYKAGILVRVTGDIIALSPPLIYEKNHIDELLGKLATVVESLE